MSACDCCLFFLRCCVKNKKHFLVEITSTTNTCLLWLHKKKQRKLFELEVRTHRPRTGVRTDDEPITRFDQIKFQDFGFVSYSVVGVDIC